jgi:3,5-epimerase/4-reductase
MKVLIYGHAGWIGQQLVDIFKKTTHQVILGESRVDNKEMLEKEINKINPTNVISLIGRTHGTYNNKEYPTIDYLEQPGKIYENVRDNLFGPVVLAMICNKYNIHLTYMGTGCIFKYDEDHLFGQEKNGFTEDSKPNFFGSGYSVVKGFTDELMHLFDNCLNVRIRMPITNINNSRNFITKIVNYQKICSVPNSMTVLPELLPIMIDMANKKIVGTINLTNPGLISHNEILEMYKEYVDNNFTWSNFSVEEQNKILAAGRSNNFLDTTRLTVLYPNVKHIKESIKEILINYKT